MLCLDFILETVVVSLIINLTQLESPKGGIVNMGLAFENVCTRLS